ncbi:MAG: rRNA pseudouridine synthase [Acidobacteria bacterium]|nr:rRNA pseudouridine synthase [Acidobacteriota bacterium]
MERVQKLIAERTRYSRRKAEDLIVQGRVTIDGRPAQLGDKADPDGQRICIDGKPLPKPAPRIYLLLNKPRGYLCTVSDPGHRKTVLDLVDTREPVYPVGRLDMFSTGLVILTNDGELAQRVMQAGPHCPKVYLVKVAGNPDDRKIQRLERGILYEGERFGPCEIRRTKTKPDSYTWFRVTLYQGKNRQIRRMFEAVQHPVYHLKRVAIGPLTDANLPVGHFRELTPAEVNRLKNPMPENSRKSNRRRPPRPSADGRSSRGRRKD